MSVDLDRQPYESQYLQYRSLSGIAVATFIIGLISLPALIVPTWMFWALIGLPLGLIAVFRVRARPEELAGAGLATLGLLFCATSLIGGIGVSTYTYMTEVPEGYERLRWAELQPDKEHPEMPIPPSALDLDGERVFVRGYVHPSTEKKVGIKRFILVPDMKTCCFGGQPALTDMIEVTLRDPFRINYSYRPRRLGGILQVSETKKRITGLDGVYYELDADYVANPQN